LKNKFFHWHFGFLRQTFLRYAKMGLLSVDGLPSLALRLVGLKSDVESHYDIRRKSSDSLKNLFFHWHFGFLRQTFLRYAKMGLLSADGLPSLPLRLVGLKSDVESHYDIRRKASDCLKNKFFH